ncbi:hypothetical protein VTN00DRAFT_4062 [Thermoascus crustaceus]|uniref:uncharacterized protein n=1 Tax=Thermoascus crustaceus TaxID=5088 RepID=UPI00374435B9
MPTTAEPAPTSAPSLSEMETSPETLESSLITHLASTSALEDLHATLLASLQRAGWTERIRTLSLELLRAGRCERFDDVVDTVVALAEGRTHPAVMSNNNNNNGDGDGSSMNGGGDSDRDRDADAFFENVDVRIPRAVVDEGVKAIKEALREVVVIDDDSDGEGGGDVQEEGKGAVKTEAADESATAALKNGHNTAAGKKASKHKPKAGKDVKSSQ